ncbi:hypothetical protein Lser_V15G19240 [Lactuca serriola]
MGTIHDYMKEFTTLTLEIPDLSDDDAFFYFFDRLKGWAKTKLKRRGVKDIATKIAKTEELVEFGQREPSKSRDPRRANFEKNGGERSMQSRNAAPRSDAQRAKNTRRTSFNNKSDARPTNKVDDEAKRLGINYVKEGGSIKAMNSATKPVAGVAHEVEEKIGEWEGVINLSVVSMDDFQLVLGWSSLIRHSLEEHVSHATQVFRVLRGNQLYVKVEKCSFAQQEVEFLGHKVKDGGLMTDEGKFKSIRDWEEPTKVTKLRSFLGLVNYYRHFIKGYSSRAAPLTDLLKKDKTWRWDSRCQEALQELKETVMQEPV